MAAIALVVAGCSGEDASAPSGPDADRATRSTPESASSTDAAGAAGPARSEIAGLADFLEQGERPPGCEELTAAPPDVTDARARWLLGGPVGNAIDGVAIDGAEVWLEVDGSASTVHTVRSGEDSEIQVDGVVSSVASEEGQLYGVLMLPEGSAVVRIDPSGATEVVVDLPDVVVGAELSAEAGQFQLLDLSAAIGLGRAVRRVSASAGAEPRFEVDPPYVAVGPEVRMWPNQSRTEFVLTRGSDVLGCKLHRAGTAVGAAQLIQGTGG
jgi:hypothetical protein